MALKLRGITSKGSQINFLIAIVLLEDVARKETEQLDDDAFEGVCRRPIFGSVQHRHTDVITIDIWMLHATLNGDSRRAQWIVVIEYDSQMQRIMFFRRQDETCFANNCVVEVKKHVWIWILLELRKVVKQSALEGVSC